MERDDIIEYSLHAHHSEEEGRKIRKKIWMVTAILTAVTAVEVIIGVYMGRSISTGTTWQVIKWSYLVLTIFKAFFIVMTFMHLGDERRSLKYVILTPYILFICYLIFIALTEALAVGDAWATYGA